MWRACAQSVYARALNDPESAAVRCAALIATSAICGMYAQVGMHACACGACSVPFMRQRLLSKRASGAEI